MIRALEQLADAAAIVATWFLWIALEAMYQLGVAVIAVVIFLLACCAALANIARFIAHTRRSS